MASKAQIIEYISEKYQDSEGMPVSLARLDSIKKSELEEFLKKNNEEENIQKWIENKN